MFKTLIFQCICYSFASNDVYMHASIPTEDDGGFSHTVCVVLLVKFVVFSAASGLKYTTNTRTTMIVIL